MRTPPTLGRNPVAQALSEQATAARAAPQPHRFGTAPSGDGPPPYLVDGQALFRDATRLAREGRLDEAVKVFDELIRLAPDHADALNDRGNALDLLRRRREALESYERALRVRPEHIHALNGRANMLQAFGRQEEALRAYDEVLAIDPRYVHAWNGRGNALMALNRHREALDAYLMAQSIRPDHPDANFNEGLARLSLGDYETGWRKHELRWSLPFWRPRLRGFHQPQWSGGIDARGKVVLLHAEQGFGDTLQFCRYLPLVAALGPRVVFEVQPALRELLAQVPGWDVLVARGDPLPDFDLHCPLLSLPNALATTLDSIPPPRTLRADPARVARWRERLGERRRLRVGIAWQGNTGHDNDRNRSIAFARFATLFVPGCEFVSLQPQVPARDAAALSADPRVVPIGAELRDFADTAAVVAQLDLVVAVDTSVAHLAASMGKPAWVLLPWVADWRWLLEREDSPWYPTVRLFRQPVEGDWDSVLARVRESLSALGACVQRL